MNTFSKPLFWVLIFLLGLTLIFALMDEKLPTSKIKRVSFSEFVEYIKTGEVQKITVKRNQLLINLKNGGLLSTEKESETSLTATLKNYNISEKELVNLTIDIKSESGLSFWLGILLPIFLPVILIFAIFWFIFRRANQGAAQIFSFSRANIRLFSSQKDNITFKDVAGLKEAKEELKEIVEFLKTPKKFLDLGAKIPRGILLMGPPGSGKTLLARAVAGEANVPFFHISGSEFVELFVGVGAGRVRDLFSTAKKNAPCILFIDEIDAVGRERGAGLGGGHDEREQTLNQILVEMDGFDRETRVIVISATNRPDILDPALLRPGRFDRRVILDLPDIKEREEILNIHVKDKKLTADINTREIAERTPGFSGADLANLTNEAAILAGRRNKKLIEQIELIDSIEKVLLGPERKSRMLSQKEKEIAAYHEAGHAVISNLLPISMVEVRKISIIARGRAGGYTMRMPKEERYLKTLSEFLADLSSLLGGYVAEELKFKEISTGAANDLKEASDIARSLVTKYGMSKFGPISFGKTEEMIFLGKDLITEKDYSEETAAKIDQEMVRIMNSCYEQARKILKENFTKLEEVAKELIKKETLEKEEFENLMAIKRNLKNKKSSKKEASTG